MSSTQVARFALRKMPSLTEVAEFADKLGWPMEKDIKGDQTRRIFREVTWFAKPRLNLKYVEDLLSPQCCVVLQGDDEDVTRISKYIIEHLNPWSVEELLANARDAADPVRRAHAVVRLGMGSPDAYDKQFFRQLSEALHDSDEWVREAAIWATHYCRYAKLVKLLEQVAANDPEEHLRTAAQDAARALRTREERS